MDLNLKDFIDCIDDNNDNCKICSGDNCNRQVSNRLGN